ncbi:MAG TPA: hypothetical protein VJ801_00485 [Polyangia bacterium]|jgi:hypothetical protein|nr:hypothetical protein [Polyangia bacterium]
MNKAEPGAEHNCHGILDSSAESERFGWAPDGELSEPSVVKESLTTAADGKNRPKAMKGQCVGISDILPGTP